MKRLVFSFGLILLLLTACCINSQPPAEDNAKIRVITTILPLQEFTEKVGGNKVAVTALIPPGGDPHTYEPRPNQLIELSNAKMYVEAGSGIEFELSWKNKLADLNKQMIFINASSGIQVINSSDPDESGMDSHTWSSVRNAQSMIETIYEGLAKIDPVNEAYYKQNKEDYILELQAMDMELNETFALKKNKKFIIYHPSLGYFAKDYNLEQIAIEKEGKEPTPQWMERVITTAKENNITVIMASPEFSTASAETMAKEVKGRVILVDPLQKDYTKGIREISAAFNNYNNQK